MVLRTCVDCSFDATTEEDLIVFKLDKRHETGRAGVCKPCNNLRVKKHTSNNPGHWRSREYKTKYGITLEDYNNMFQEQDGCCAICNMHQTGLKKRLFVDHCHDSGEVRKLLCHHCNSALGFFKDNTDILATAIAYINEHKGN